MAQPSDPAPRRRGPGRPFVKGDPRSNRGGIPKEVRDLREALRGEGQEIHDALMGLVRSGNPAAIIYAHTQIVGKAKETVEHKGSVGISNGYDLRRLASEQLEKLDALLTAARGTGEVGEDENPPEA